MFIQTDDPQEENSMNEMFLESLRFVFRHQYGIKILPEEGDHEAAMKAVMICAKGDGTLSAEEKAWISGVSAMVGNPFYTLARTYGADESIEEVVAASPWLRQFGGRMILFEAIRGITLAPYTPSSAAPSRCAPSSNISTFS